MKNKNNNKIITLGFEIVVATLGLFFFLMNLLGCMQYGLIYLRAHILGFIISISTMLLGVSFIILSITSEYIED